MEAGQVVKITVQSYQTARIFAPPGLSFISLNWSVRQNKIVQLRFWMKRWELRVLKHVRGRSKFDIIE